MDIKYNVVKLKDNSTEEIKEWGEKELSKYGEVEFLTFTDYQSRGLFKLVVE